MLGITRMSQPGPFGRLPGCREAHISGGVICSLSSQNGHFSPGAIRSSSTTAVLKRSGRCPRSVEMMTHLPIIGSRRSSGILNDSPSQEDQEIGRVNDAEDIAELILHYDKVALPRLDLVEGGL